MFRTHRGFALPTVLVAGTLMLIVLATALVATTSVRSAVQQQYYDQLAREAAESGLAMAEACIDAGTTTWANPLRPSSNCNGGTNQCDNSDNCWVMKTDQVRTYFSVPTPSGTSGVRAVGTVELLRKSSGAVWKSFSFTDGGLPSSAPAPVSTGLVLSLDAGNPDSYSTGSSTWRDLSGNGNNGTITGSVSYSTEGGGSLNFGGSGYVNIPDAASLKTTGSQTIDFWVRPADLAAGRQNILDKAYGGEFATTLETDGRITAYYGTAGGRANPYSGWSLGPVPQDTWSHVAVVRDLSTMRANSYVNGRIVAWGDLPYSSAVASTFPVTIGYGYTGIYYNGLVSNVRIYNRALSVTEIGQNYTSQRSRYITANQASCLSILKAGLSTGSGVYTISPTGTPLTVYCDMTTDGGGWTLVLQNNSSVSTPSPNWEASTNANTISGTMNANRSLFDQLVGLNYWNSIGTQLRAQVGTSPTAITRNATYSFYLDDRNGYALKLSNENIILGGISPGLYSYHNNFKWTTYDVDLDIHATNCSASYNNHPWWYGSCWNGNFFAGGSGYQEAAYWTGSTSDYYTYGALWVR